MVKRCQEYDFDTIYEIINDSALAYKNVIPHDCWHEPYMTKEKLKSEIMKGIEFWCYEENGTILGVMGIQQIQDITLIRHAYIRPQNRRQGIGSLLLEFLKLKIEKPIFIGTWSAANWAIAFYQKHEFFLVKEDIKTKLLKKYWNISERQNETSVVLADKKALQFIKDNNYL